MSDIDQALPQAQHAVQLVGPGQLQLNTSKAVPSPGPTQVLAEIEVAGLCFSDLKLLKQFTGHVRKSEIVDGLPANVLAEIPSYVPGKAPTVPGHEAVCRIAAIGKKVTRHRVGERYLIQTDYRHLRTARSNAAFGYNFEGALQEYVIMDERVIIDPETDESFLIPVPEDLSASAIALVEPWACVEDSYVTTERAGLLAGGKLLLIAAEGHCIEGLREAAATDAAPADITLIAAEETHAEQLRAQGLAAAQVITGTNAADAVATLPNAHYSDIVYFGAEAATIAALSDKLAARGICNLVTAGKRIGEAVSVDVGRIHYGMTRWTGTTTTNAADSYSHIPHTGEVREGDRVLVIGAGGPMGQMHVIRNVSLGLAGTSVTGTDFDAERLASLAAKAQPLAQQHAVPLALVNPQETPLDGTFSYIGLMAPVPQLVARAIVDASSGARINIFAGIPAGTRIELDLDRYIANRVWMFGTSGSKISDMKIVLEKVISGSLDTNRSVDAVSGMAGAIDGLHAVEDRTLAGKIIVYPQAHDLGLIPLDKLHEHLPEVAELLHHGIWTREAEDALQAVAL